MSNHICVIVRKKFWEKVTAVSDDYSLFHRTFADKNNNPQPEPTVLNVYNKMAPRWRIKFFFAFIIKGGEFIRFCCDPNSRSSYYFKLSFTKTFVHLDKEPLSHIVNADPTNDVFAEYHSKLRGKLPSVLLKTQHYHCSTWFWNCSKFNQTGFNASFVK